MRRRFQGLASNSQSDGEVLDGIFLVEVDHGRYCEEPRKPFYALHFQVLEPKPLAGRAFVARLYCSRKALWKLNWFLRDFGYDLELLARDEIDDKRLTGLRGVVKVSHATDHGYALINLDAFAPSSAWAMMSSPVTPSAHSELAS